MDFNQNNNQFGGNNQPTSPQQNNMGYNPQFNGGQFSANPYYNATPGVNNQYQQYNQPQQMGQMYSYNYQNNQQNHFVNQQRFLILREQKKEIKKFSTIFAIAMLGFLVASLLVSSALEIAGLTDLYYNNGAFSSAIGIFYSVVAVGLPFFIAKKKIGNHESLPTASYSAPKANFKTVCIIFLSIFGCIASMYITGYIQVFFEMFGVTFSAGDEPKINSVIDIIALFIGTAVIPPLIEEFAMRNVVMQPLRKYGNLFAIIISAFAFGIFHGTPTQIPFAFLCGLFLSYAVIATDSIWTGIIIHAVVNGVSCVYYAVRFFTDEETADLAYGIVCLAIGAIGFISLIIYANRYKDEFKRIISKNGLEEYTLKQKVSKFICTPAMIIAIIVFLIQAFSMISFGSGVTV